MLSPCCFLFVFFIASLTVSKKKAAWAANVSGSRGVCSHTVTETSRLRAALEGHTSKVNAVSILDEVTELLPEGQQLVTHIELYKLDHLNKRAHVQELSHLNHPESTTSQGSIRWIQ